ncbi:hypothetical protein [Stieleria varia]|uniref:Uncharacterized protein n=1 Tax=Stieleria varia TaxID=2528005 RepID=A0A5C6AW58_9BACT|nr:hypothetical protein [Stieleria varia]TWU02364.1 hypothetical protein Pla52n_34140 [Stieleria varia]
MQDNVSPVNVTDVACHSPSTMRSTAMVGRRASDSAQPKIEIRKQGDKIESIVVTCACGQVITLDCAYGEVSA